MLILADLAILSLYVYFKDCQMSKCVPGLVFIPGFYKAEPLMYAFIGKSLGTSLNSS